MYFIARNNAFYNYIAHTSLKRCYFMTLFCVSAFFVVGIYGIYFPLCAHVALLQSECMMLQKKSDDSVQLHKNGDELSIAVALSKKNIDARAVVAGKREEHCHQQMLFVLDSITKAGLTLTAYGSCKEKDKAWYSKDSAHFDVVGSIGKIMVFLEAMKMSRSMITLSRVMLTRLADDNFQMGFDIGLIVIKK